MFHVKHFRLSCFSSIERLATQSRDGLRKTADCLLTSAPIPAARYGDGLRETFPLRHNRDASNLLALSTSLVLSKCFPFSRTPAMNVVCKAQFTLSEHFPLCQSPDNAALLFEKRA